MRNKRSNGAQRNKYGTEQDPACYSGTNILINKLEIRDADELANVEKVLTELRVALFEPNFSSFDLAALQSIHCYLFQDIYPWAGQLRSVDISKGNTRFCSTNYIEKESNKLLQKLAKENYLNNLPLSVFVEKIADYYCELNVIHPFREGNGRTQRIFFELISLNAGYELKWSNIEKDEWINANIAGYIGDLFPLHILFNKIISHCT